MVSASIEKRSNLPTVSSSMFTSDGFDLIQRVAKAYSSSNLVPQQYQGNIANCVIACNMAVRMDADPLMVMQNLYIVHGKPSWSAQYYISALNSCGRYSSLHYEWFGVEGRDDWGCRAWVTEKSSGQRIEGPRVTIGMAKAEGWFSKNGSKWKTMPELMLSYRAAAFFVRTHAPELTMGLPMADEMLDVGPAAPSRREPIRTTIEALAVEPELLPEPAPEAEPEYRQLEGELANPDQVDAMTAFAESEPKAWEKMRRRLEINSIETATEEQAKAACVEIAAARTKGGGMFGGEESNAYKQGK